MLPAIAAPFALGAGWWLWYQGRSESRHWRFAAVIIGFAAATVNAVTYYGWLAWTLTVPPSDDRPRTILRVHDFLANNVAFWMVIVALTAAVVGKGRGQWALGIAAVIGFCLWVRLAG
jgi:hypothetical protein